MAVMGYKEYKLQLIVALSFSISQEKKNQCWIDHIEKIQESRTAIDTIAKRAFG